MSVLRRVMLGGSKIQDTQKIFYTSDNKITTKGLSILFHRYDDLSKEGTIICKQPVIEIPESCFLRTNIQLVTLPESVSKIGDHSFQGCDKLSRISIPYNVADIGEYAFYDCGALEVVDIGSQITEIPSYAFMFCGSLKDIYLPRTITKFGKDAFYISENIERVILDSYDYKAILEVFAKSEYENQYSNPLSYGALLCYKNGNPIKYVRIDGNVSPHAFSGCANVFDQTSIYEWESIGAASFKGVNLGYVSLTAHGGTIAESAFEKATLTHFSVGMLTNSVIPYGAITIDGGAFRYSKGLKSITTHSIKKIGAHAFISSDLEAVFLMSVTVELSEYNPFSNCPLTQISVEKSNQKYDSRQDCNAIIETSTNKIITACSNTVIPDGILAIYPGAFSSARNIRNLEIPGTVSELPMNEFYGFKNLTSLKIGEGLTKIESECFRDVPLLETVELPESLTEIGDMTFYQLPSLPIFDDITYADSVLVKAADLTRETYNIKEGTKFIEHTAFASAEMTHLFIPRSVIQINPYAFIACKYMQYYDFSSHDHIPRIYSNSFDGIPKSCKIIVPDSLYDEWVMAKNWSSYADYVIKKTDYDSIVRIQSIDGELYTYSEWMQSGFSGSHANGISVSTSIGDFIIAKNTIGQDVWSNESSTLIPGVVTANSSNASEALADYSGKRNTNAIAAASTSGAAYSCMNYTFPGGANGYLPALGEWKAIAPYLAKINQLVDLVGGDQLTHTYWSSTQVNSTQAWNIKSAEQLYGTSNKSTTQYIRPFMSY